MSAACTFYVYVWFRPWDGSPCYVGKGAGKRWKNWYRPHNKHLINLLKKAGGSLPAVKVREGLTESQAFETEIALIAAIGRKRNKGPLVNLTNGGDGASGLIQTAETRAKVGNRSRAMWEDPEARKMVLIAQAIGKSGPEFHAMRSAASKLTWTDADLRAKLSVTQRARLADPEKRLALSIATKAGMASPGVFERHSAAQKARFEQPEEKSKQGRTAGTRLSDEHRAKISAGNRGKVVSAETRDKLRVWNTGRKLPQDAVEKMRSKGIARWENIEITDEFRAKMRDAARKRWDRARSIPEKE